MRLSLELVVIAIVILVVAVVMLSFFGLGMQNANQITDARNQCINIASASCQSMNVMPPTWTFETVRVGDKMMSCKELTGKEKCSEFGGSEPQTKQATNAAECAAAGGECLNDCGTKEGLGSCSDRSSAPLCCKKQV